MRRCIPSDLSDFNRYGGLYRHVILVLCPGDFVGARPHRANARRGRQGQRQSPRAALQSDGRQQMKSNLPSKSATRRETSSRLRRKNSPRGRVRRKSPHLQSPSRNCGRRNPRRFTSCTVTLKSPQGEQTVSENFGVRSFEWVEHGPFKLNGERLLLRGTHYHEDHAGVAAAVPDDVVRQTLQTDQGHGREFRAARSLPAIAAGAGVVRSNSGCWCGRKFPWCRGGLGGERYQQQALRHAAGR